MSAEPTKQSKDLGTERSHVVCQGFGPEGGAKCLNCGATLVIKLPATVDDWVGAMKSFEINHLLCAAPKMAQETPPSQDLGIEHDPEAMKAIEYLKGKYSVETVLALYEQMAQETQPSLEMLPAKPKEAV